MRCPPSSPGCHTRASWPPAYRHTTAGTVDGSGETPPSAPQRAAGRHASAPRVVPSSGRTELGGWYGRGTAVLSRFSRFVHPSSVFTRAPSSGSLIFESRGLVGSGKCIFLLLCCRCCQAPLWMFFPSILDALVLGLDCSGAFLWCGNLVSRTPFSPCELSRPSTVSQCILAP